MTMPELNIYISYYANSELPEFYKLGLNAKKVDDISKANIVLFRQGLHISPWMYNSTYKDENLEVDNEKRDEVDIKNFNYCLVNKIPMLGTDRGMQLLSVLNGYRLMEPAKNNHHLHMHKVVSVDKIHTFNVVSYHSKIVTVLKYMQELSNIEIIAHSEHFTPWLKYKSGETNNMLKVDPEIVYFQETRCLGMQFSPEWFDLNKDREQINYCLKIIKKSLLQC
jgi:hypothetical protein